MWESVRRDLVFLLFAGPYIAGWWWALRCVAGRMFVPWEWVPLAILGLGIPILLNEMVYESPLRSLGPVIVSCWMALPMPIIATSLLVRWIGKMRGRNQILRDIQQAREEIAQGRCRVSTPGEIMKELLND